MSQEYAVYLSIIIPAYNEQEKIRQDIVALYAFFKKKDYSIEVIAVDDGSRDSTLKNLYTCKNEYPNLKVITYKKNQGKGYALKQGMLAASGKYVLFVDAGSCVPFSHVEQGLDLLQNGYSLAVGSRRHQKSEIVNQQPKYRRIGGELFGWIARYLMQVNGVSDTQCGFKMFTNEAAKSLFKANQIKGFMFDVETILRAQRLGLRIGEFPVTWANDPDTRFNPVWGSFRNIYELLLVKINLMRKK